MSVIRLRSKEQLEEFRRTYGLRKDWHEPDNEDVDAKVIGQHFDNTGCWGYDREDLPMDAPWREMTVLLFVKGDPVAEANLADLLAWACR